MIEHDQLRDSKDEKTLQKKQSSGDGSVWERKEIPQEMYAHRTSRDVEFSDAESMSDDAENTDPEQIPKQDKSALQTVEHSKEQAHPGNHIPKKKAKKAESDSPIDQTASEKQERPFEDIMTDVLAPIEKTELLSERFYSLFMDLKRVKNLSTDETVRFFLAVRDILKVTWAPFLTKMSLHVNPRKGGNDQIIAKEIINSCKTVLSEWGMPEAELVKLGSLFCQYRDEDDITAFLKKAQKSNPGLRQIPDQELACATYTFLTLKSREYSPNPENLLVRIDRAIAEFFAVDSQKDKAGKTLGSILTAKTYSPKKIGDLTYLYADTRDVIKKQKKQIDEMAAANERLKAEVEKRVADHKELNAQIAALESEKTELQKNLLDLENRLEYERNWMHQQMREKENAIAGSIAEELELEIESIKETSEYVDEDNQRRIRKRLQRIDSILNRFGGNKDA